MGTFIITSDLAPFADIPEAKASEMIADAESQAILAASCLASLPDAPDGETPAERKLREAKMGAVKAILRAAILRWNDAGSGAVQTEVTGPFSTMAVPQARRSMFWPSEIADLQSICRSADAGKAFGVDTMGGGALVHQPWCALYFAATYCSCGADIAGSPIYEGPW